MNTQSLQKRILLFALIGLPLLTLAQGQILTGTTCFSNALFNTLIGVIILFLIIIIALSAALKNLAQSDYLSKEKTKNDKSGNSIKTIGIILLSLMAFNSNAQQIVEANNKAVLGGLDMFTFYFLLAIIVIEVIFIVVLLHTLHYLLKSNTPKVLILPVKKEKSILEILNASVAIEKEEEILMGHEYDGIRELDNDLPPWWRYGFYLTIVVAAIYLIHYHVTLTGDLQLAEYNKEIAKGKADVAEFMKMSADNVDESTVKMMPAGDIESGKIIFISTCSACHGKFGEGGVGPNLTDEYFLHGGSLSDVFKTIKYGWPDKGMKSWKEDLSPIQIAQLCSFIKTLKGTNPPKAKTPQGDLYSEKSDVSNDSLAMQKDSLRIKTADDSSAAAKKY